MRSCDRSTKETEMTRWLGTARFRMVNSAGSLVLEQRVIEETPDRSSLAENEIQNKRNTTRPNPPFT